MSKEAADESHATPARLPRLAQEDEAAVRDLHTTYWARTDGRDPSPPEDLFSDDALFQLGSMTLRGRDELTAFFRKRQSDQEANGRVTRHLSTDLTLRLLADGRVATASTVLAIAGYGALPAPSSVPSIADFNDICVKHTDGRWLFDRRSAQAVFAGPQAPSFARGPAASPKHEKREDEC